MTDDKPTCPAVLALGGDTDACTRRSGHPGDHRDADGDAWNITGLPGGICSSTYLAPVDRRSGNYLHGRSHDDLIKELYQRLSKLESPTEPAEPADGTVTVDADVLSRLRRDQATLRALQSAGVDNWEGYGHAMSLLDEEPYEGDGHGDSSHLV